MKLIYFDNPLVRSLAETPKTWDQLYDPFINTFGRTFKPFKSCYLFLEYIGFTKKKLQIPTVLKSPTFANQEELAKMDKMIEATITKERIALLDEGLSKITKDLDSHIKDKVRALRATFENRVEQMEKRVANFKGAHELLQELFGDITSFMHTDFDGFVQYVSRYLSWDAFCSIHPMGISLPVVRDRQMVYWFQFWEEGAELPVGKIIDDQRSYLAMDFQSPFKEFEDMVDSELHTHLVLGHRINGEVHPFCALAYPPNDLHAFEARNRLALGAITRIEEGMQRTLVKQPGKLYILDPATHSFKEVHEPMFKIQL